MIDEGIYKVPDDFGFKVGAENHLENTAKFSMFLNATQPTPDPEHPLPQSELNRFGNWTGQTDTKIMAQDLKRRGLIGADQLLMDSVNIDSANSIKNSQSDWKVAAIQDILANARKLNIRTPEAVMANKNILISSPKWREAINNDSFNNIHPNFWNVITHSILPEQYSKFDVNTDIAKK